MDDKDFAEWPAAETAAENGCRDECKKLVAAIAEKNKYTKVFIGLSHSEDKHRGPIVVGISGAKTSWCAAWHQVDTILRKHLADMESWDQIQHGKTPTERIVFAQLDAAEALWKRYAYARSEVYGRDQKLSPNDVIALAALMASQRL